ncbi:hypothetical protein [Brevibacterium salitolerans]|uniref:hypothetical protein n=1 Tax=Brevibacterium salitolerans TaxID=1403566 RepID=UPI0031D97EAF
MTNLSPDDVLGLIRDVDGDSEGDLRRPHVVSTGEHPPHLIWGLGKDGATVAIGLAPQGLEYRIGEFWASGWDDLEPTQDPWVIEGMQRTADTLRRSIDSALKRRAERAARESAPRRPTAARVIDYLRHPSPERFEQLLSAVTVRVDHRDDDDAVVARIARMLPTGTLAVDTAHAPAFTIAGPGGERTVTPTGRDVTLRALAAVLGPDIELRRWVDDEPGDTVAVLVFTASERRAIIEALSQRALDARFRLIGARSRVFS